LSAGWPALRAGMSSHGEIPPRRKGRDMLELMLRFAWFVAGWGGAFICFMLGYLLVLAWAGSRRP